MFMPPGMCLCQFAPVAGSADSSVSAPSADAPTPTSPEKRCCQRCSRQADPDPAAPVPAPQPAEPLQPAPPSHDPDCPVVTGLSPWTAVLADSVGAEWCLPAAVFVDLVAETSTSVPLADAGPAPARSAAIFLSYCTLLV